MSEFVKASVDALPIIITLVVHLVVGVVFIVKLSARVEGMGNNISTIASDLKDTRQTADTAKQSHATLSIVTGEIQTVLSDVKTTTTETKEAVLVLKNDFGHMTRRVRDLEFKVPNGRGPKAADLG